MEIVLKEIQIDPWITWLMFLIYILLAFASDMLSEVVNTNYNSAFCFNALLITVKPILYEIFDYLLPARILLFHWVT